MSVPEFKTEKVSDRITRIYAFSSELMYLVEGSERAALLDSGSGIGFVRPLIEQLTEHCFADPRTCGPCDGGFRVSCGECLY